MERYSVMYNTDKELACCFTCVADSKEAAWDIFCSEVRSEVDTYLESIHESYLFKKYCVCSACKNRLTVTTAQTSAREIHYYKCQCTSLYISEDKILDLVEDTFTNVYWNDLYSKQMDKLKAQYRVSNTSLRRIKSAVSDFGVSEMQLSDLVDKETEKNRTIKKAILTLRKKLEQTSFRTLSYEKQRDFLRNHVECIVVYLKMVDVKIKWKK